MIWLNVLNRLGDTEEVSFFQPMTEEEVVDIIRSMPTK